MNERLKKQIFYFLIFLSPVLIFGGVYLYKFFKPTPTCFDKIRNQGELDVDCGGPCPPCEIKNLQPIIKYPVRDILYPDGSYDFYFKVFNPNEDWGLKEIGYSLIFYNEENKIIYQTEKFKTSLNPKETKILTFQNLKPPNFFKVEANLEINDFNWIQTKPVNLDLISYSPKIFENNLGLTSVKFDVYNRSSFDFSNVEAIIILYDSFKQPTGLTKINFSIKSEEVKTLEVNFPFKLTGYSVEIFFQTSQ